MESSQQSKSNKQYDEVVATARREFSEKFDKYGNSLKYYSIYSVLEKIFIKLNRLNEVQEKGTMLVDEPIDRVFYEVLNYCLYGLYRTKRGPQKIENFLPDSKDDILTGYDNAAIATKALFENKNNDYGEAWRNLSISFMTQESLTKRARGVQMYKDYKFTKPEKLIKELNEIFQDIANYMIFCRIRIDEGANPLF